MKRLCALLLAVSLASVYATPLKLVQDEEAQTISAFRPNGDEAILVQNTRSDHLERTQDPRVVGGLIEWDYYPHYGNRRNKNWKVEEKP